MRLATRVLLACLALLLLPAAAHAVEPPVEITKFDISRYAHTPSDPEFTQAGAHPNVGIYMQFCGSGIPIKNVEVIPSGQPNAGALKVTTAVPHGHLSFLSVRVIGVKGILSANSSWLTSVASPTELILFGSGFNPAVDSDYVANSGEVFIPEDVYGCTPSQKNSYLKDFTLKLPPGFLGSPTAVPACPTHLWLAGSCPDNTQLGHAVADTVPAGGLFIVPTSVFNLQTLGWEPARLGTEVVPGIPPGPLPNTVTLRTAPDPVELGEPNQQGSNAFPGDQGDYGVTSYQINIPKELGGNTGKVRAIDIVLCARVPCQEVVRNAPQTSLPQPPTEPFFVNPTSCGTKTARLEARSYSVPDEVQTLNIPAGTSGGTFTLSFNGETTAPIAYNTTTAALQSALEALGGIGAGNVSVSGLPVSASANGVYSVYFRGLLASKDVPQMTADSSGLTPAGTVVVATSNNGQNSGESFEDFENESLAVTGCDAVPFTPDVNVTPTDSSPGASDRQTISIDYPDGYEHDDIWQAQLKDADTILPEGMSLAPGGGVGLKECSFAQFGADPATGRQLNNKPDECPEGSHVGDIEVVSPIVPAPLDGKAFFGPTGSAGRPTDANPWKLFLLLEGQGVRIKLVGDVTLSPSGQVRTVFRNNPETPFTHFRLKMGDAARAVLMMPLSCGPHAGHAPLTGYNGKTRDSTFSVEPTNCPADPPFQPTIDEASAQPEQAGSHSVSHIVISRPDGNDMLSGLKLSLPPGAAGSLSAVPKCPLAQAQAGACPDSTVVGNIKTTLGSGISLFTVPGKLFLAEAAVPGDVASIVATVPAKAGVPNAQGKYPIDLGPDVVIINRLRLRDEDTGVDTILLGAYRNGEKISDGIPTVLEGVPLPVRQIEITVDREGFFLNPTGCTPRDVVGTFTSASGKTATSNFTTQAKGCDKLPFDPTLYMIVGERGKTNAGQNVHPPLTAIVTQKAGEAAIAKARVLVPDIVRPNVPFLNEPNALCTDAQAQARACPAKSLVGSARVITPVLPFELRGPVHIVQEIGNILPKLYIYLRGGGFEVLLKARNRITGVRTENTFDFVPDVPQSYFELNIEGGKDGLLNNFFDLCTTAADSKSRRVEATFTGHNGAVKNSKFPVRVEGCGSSLAAARIATTRIAVNRKGIAKVKVGCRRKDGQCRGSLRLTAKGLAASKSFRIAKRKSRTLKLKFSKGEVKRLRKAKRKQMKGRATTKVGSSSSKRTVTLVYRRR